MIFVVQFLSRPKIAENRVWLFTAALLFSLLQIPARACDLCAIYRATNARGESSSGFLLTLSEQFIAYDTFQLDGKRFHDARVDPAFEQSYMDSSITHIVPTYNFSEQFGVSLNLPIIYRSFRRVQQVTGNPDLEDETGTVSGLGDISLVGRWTPLRISKMKYSIVGSLFAGVKFPSGDTDRVDREVAQELQLREDFGPGHNHPYGGIHQHDLTLGSGSYDGVFGGALTLRWDRWFLSSQGQYYLRTEANLYEFGDEIMVSGGPGVYILSNSGSTLTLQANAVYDTMARDTVLGLKSSETGWTGWFMGPQLNFTWRDHFSANAGVDIPLRIINNGFQTVPDYRFHGGVSWRF